MNQNNNYPFPFDEGNNPREIPDISDEIAADVAAILGSNEVSDIEVDAIVSAVEDSTGKFGTGLEAIMAEAGDPSLDIGADVAAIMAEQGDSFADIRLNESVAAEDAADPTVAIREDVAAIMSETVLASTDPVASFDEEILPIAAELPLDQPPAAAEAVMNDVLDFIHSPVSDESSVGEPADASVFPDHRSAVPEEDETPGLFAAPEGTGFFQIPAEQALPAETESEAAVPHFTETVPDAEVTDATQRINTEDPLYHDLLNDPAAGVDIGADEHAISSAGLIHPADAELEKIIEETLADDPSRSADLPSGDATDLTVVFPAETGEMLIQDYVDSNHPIAQPPVEEEKENAYLRFIEQHDKRAKRK